MADDAEQQRLQRAVTKLKSVPSIALPMDYPRPTTNKLVEAVHSQELDSATSLSLLKLALYQDDSGESAIPTPFQLLLSAFVVLLHRYTGDSDLVIASSSAAAHDPLLLRVSIEPTDSFITIVRRVQQIQLDSEKDAAPFDKIVHALGADQEGSAPLFRVRFFDETDELPKSSFIRSTSLTSDLTVFVTRPQSSTSAHATLVPRLSLRISYNSLLFKSTRISLIVDQLSNFFQAISANPQNAIGTVPLLTPSQRLVLPNPTSNLNWCDWKGAITDIFSRNALAHPDKPCVVQSLPEKDANGNQLKRGYTYTDILHASNVLSHHLIKGGVAREDVVMIYAYRSVELVVAVMAVLKAGATFSVIDPAYPPARQNIYLKVAKPRALIVLSGAGKINPTIRSFISESLSIKIEVPSLSFLHSAGGAPVISGGPSPSSPPADVLDGSQHLAPTNPSVILGPDSVGTLSFTSGSTGIPKGVKGRHYSLTHFFPWMGERFGLDSEARFSMLSGIAHDPIQRDMFTPLFFGASLHVPSSEDISSPGRLADWVSENGITVTHLTPAMGQLLSSTSANVQIPSLRNAFFVGDILTKRDCLRLQSLAPNCAIINMYGTTETQRAVSYFLIPSLSSDSTFLKVQKDVIPAGKGMVDVQLIVVNRNDRTLQCGIGEVGEIYVRSGGLAEGYLDEEASAEKFIDNWFSKGERHWADTIAHPADGQLPGPESAHWKGIRDRMYRSGDLGRYLPPSSNGNWTSTTCEVECTGRADDQVKIRGFRIELGEIDVWLSQHPFVRENVTLVRRDKFEEKVLVCYFVPKDGKGLEEYVSEVEDEEDVGMGFRKYRKLIRDIREYLKKKLPSYSVPSLFVPLNRMPLNPNGKIDKPALPFPDAAVAASLPSAAAAPSAVQTLSATESTIHTIWAKLLPSPPPHIPLDENFFDMGGHSILATRLIFEMRKAFTDIAIPLGVIFEKPTIKGLSSEIERLKSADFGVAGKDEKEKSEKNVPNGDANVYSSDLDVLSPRLASSYHAPPIDFTEKKVAVFLTGATGFLGTFVLRDLLSRPDRVDKVICLVRGKDLDGAKARLNEALKDKGIPVELGHRGLEVVVGDLGEEKFGLSNDVWERVAKECDVVLHNGALVHWVYPYNKLRAANVISTLTVIELSTTFKPKHLSFVSSTSDIDTEFYVRLSDDLANKGQVGLSEDDDLEGSRTDLKTGYGQSKWVSEKLLMEAARRGLSVSIVRPGYVVGDAKSGVTNSDDFIWRLVKGCIQLGFVPDINNTVNMVPVDHVARITALSALYASSSKAAVYHVTSRPAVRFNDLLSLLSFYGYSVTRCEYVAWRRKLEIHVLDPVQEENRDNALFPLLHFVLDDLPTSTKAPELNDQHTSALLRLDGVVDDGNVSVGEELMGKYLAWLIQAGFLPAPEGDGKSKLPETQKGSIVGKALGRSGR